MPLIEISSGRSGVQLDLAYARADNVTGKPIYAQARCYLHPVAATFLDSLREVRRVTAQNSEGAKNTLRGTRSLLDTVEELVADMDGLNGNSNGNAKRRSKSNGA